MVFELHSIPLYLSTVGSQRLAPKHDGSWVEARECVLRVRGLVLEYRDDPQSASIMPDHIKNAFKRVQQEMRTTISTLVNIDRHDSPRPQGTMYWAEYEPLESYEYVDQPEPQESYLQVGDDDCTVQCYHPDLSPARLFGVRRSSGSH